MSRTTHVTHSTGIHYITTHLCFPTYTISIVLGGKYLALLGEDGVLCVLDTAFERKVRRVCAGVKPNTWKQRVFLHHFIASVFRLGVVCPVLFKKPNTLLLFLLFTFSPWGAPSSLPVGGV